MYDIVVYTPSFIAVNLLDDPRVDKTSTARVHAL